MTLCFRSVISGNGAAETVPREKWCREKWGEMVPEMVPGLESEMAEMVPGNGGKWCRVLNCESICSPEMGT
ncbi:MAG: hypothetical protein COX19_16575 [Desulfobacterales bacterium CG23_combo_of_CG06-09_8_20_14_all_51_8]|nr:MAG: hypothetical protein COX19_16575 [Desulfobacterales bacterium CG23_combo_of_CG06-09_8_20_14_all_51_8]